ncbi:hypothetical protein Xkhy_16255 [Xanthomonas axonopodis pv. khayae]|nr:hypothetical protein Xkhy_16255 [Xanthomonas axonopodis pv. khayae]
MTPASGVHQKSIEELFRASLGVLYWRRCVGKLHQPTGKQERLVVVCPFADHGVTSTFNLTHFSNFKLTHLS